MTTPTATQQLLGFIIDQELDLDQYNTLVPLLKEHFEVDSSPIFNWTDKDTEHQRLIDEIVYWEKGNQNGSLEATINKAFNIRRITEGPLPKKVQAKVVDIPGKPDPEFARIQKETTRTASVINEEMKKLQKKFPNHNFDLAFEKQFIGKNKFYKIKLKTFKDGSN